MLISTLIWMTSLAAGARGPSALAGDYVCQYGCRPTDVNPSIEIRGSEADCMNELGGLYRGQVLADGAVACFRKTGRLSPDGNTLRWDDGVIWKRHIPARQSAPSAPRDTP